jgi:hypothetical protein
MADSTTRSERRSTRTATGVTVTGVSLAALMAFGSWLVHEVRSTAETQQTSVAAQRYVTEERWRADSTRRDDQFRTLISELRDLRTDNAARLREICVALRAGCR